MLGDVVLSEARGALAMATKSSYLVFAPGTDSPIFEGLVCKHRTAAIHFLLSVRDRSCLFGK